MDEPGDKEKETENNQERSDWEGAGKNESGGKDESGKKRGGTKSSIEDGDS